MAEAKEKVKRKFEINVGKYVITSDSVCATLLCTKKYGKDSKKAGEEYLDTVGYFSRISDALEKIAGHKMMSSDAKNLADLVAIAAETKEMIEKCLGETPSIIKQIRDEEAAKAKIEARKNAGATIIKMNTNSKKPVTKPTNSKPKNKKSKRVRVK